MLKIPLILDAILSRNAATTQTFDWYDKLVPKFILKLISEIGTENNTEICTEVGIRNWY